MARRIEQSDEERALALALEVVELEAVGVSGGFLRRRLVSSFGPILALAALAEAEEARTAYPRR